MKEKIKKLLDNTFVSLVMFGMFWVIGIVVASGGQRLMIMLMKALGVVMSEDVELWLAVFLNSVGSALFAVVMTKLVYREKYTSGLNKENFWPGLKYTAVVFLLGIVQFFCYRYQGFSLVKGVDMWLVAILNSLNAGIFEELMFRAGICSLLMRKWYKSPKGIWASVILSAVLFGLMHIVNTSVTDGMTAQIIWQTVYATAIGMFFAAVFVRTRNVWGCMIAHALYDLSGLMFMAGEIGAELTREVSMVDTIYNSLFVVVCIICTLWLLRPSKLKEVTENWKTGEIQEH